MRTTRVSPAANTLSEATSPYLRQHADNPVHWQQWTPAALAEAAERDVPILLSVGYAACHWCHVMAHESFEDDQVAAAMNDGFVNIKVDREERPDIDAVYMNATVALTGQGGWPMTCFLTPDGRPFFCGTYYPKPNFLQLLASVSDTRQSRRYEVERASDQIITELRSMASALPGGCARYSVDDSWVVPHFEKMLYDNALLLRVYAHWARRTGNALARRVTRETARFMIDELSADGMFISSLDADADGIEGLTYAWTPAQLKEVLGSDDWRWAATIFGVTDAGT